MDKSSSDVAAEGAILNEMLDIVAKRAALRSNDPQYGMNSMESDVSSVESMNARNIFYNIVNTNWFYLIYLFILCTFCIYFAHR